MISLILPSLCLLGVVVSQQSQGMNGMGQQQQQQQPGQGDGQGCATCQPGYLPDYQGDRYTNQTRIQETQALNKKFFDSIGGPPSPPPLTPAQQGMGMNGGGAQGGPGYNPSQGGAAPPSNGMMNGYQANPSPMAYGGQNGAMQPMNGMADMGACVPCNGQQMNSPPSRGRRFVPFFRY